MTRGEPRSEDAVIPTTLLDGILDDLAARRGVRHALIAVEFSDGSFSWTGVRGAAHPDGTSLTPETPFFAASVTKLFTAAAVLILWERQRLDLDEPIAARLPGLVADLHRLNGVDHSASITPRHLLSHTSGLPDYFEERARGGRSFADRLEAEGDFAYTIDEVKDAVKGLRPHFAPQAAQSGAQRARYSDTNYQLLGALIEDVTRQPLHEVYESVLFEPLELHATALFGSARARTLDRPATVWMGDVALDAPLAFTSMAPEGGIVSTAADLMRFMRKLMTGSAFARRSTLDEMTRHWHRFGFSLAPSSFRTPGWPLQYGLGVMRFRMPRVFTPLHPMPPVLGHTGATGTWLFHCPDLDVTLTGTVDQAAAPHLPFRVVPRLLRVFERARKRA